MSVDTVRGEHFNPRSPCGERLCLLQQIIHAFRFQSTLPMRGATWTMMKMGNKARISIHAPHAGSDFSGTLIFPYWRFQSTLPMRGATSFASLAVSWSMISIHAPHAGSDVLEGQPFQLGRNFNPRSPCGERRHGVAGYGTGGDFNPRSPCGERPAGDR